MISPYAELVEEIVQDVDKAFYEVFKLCGPYQADDHLPGERYGVLDFQTFDRDPSRQLLRNTRGGVEAKIFRASILISSAFDQEGLSERECLNKANTMFLSEALEIEAGLVEMKALIANHQFIYDLQQDGPIDKAVSVTLHDSPRTWQVSATCSIVLSFVVNRDISGHHILPITLHPNT